MKSLIIACPDYSVWIVSDPYGGLAVGVYIYSLSSRKVSAASRNAVAFLMNMLYCVSYPRFRCVASFAVEL
jgi:hypothetical protein